MTSPFTYPAVAHVRRHGPRGYADYESYRPWIRDGFAFRCVYCLIREIWGPVQGVYALDHFLPVVARPDLALEYDNVLYGCVSCNLSKGRQVTPDPLCYLLDPVVHVAENGVIHAETPAAGKLIEMLRLNRPRLCEFRGLWIRIVRLAARCDPALLRQLLGYPAELPDLSSLRPPDGNARPAGVAQSHRARRQRGELPDTYGPIANQAVQRLAERAAAALFRLRRKARCRARRPWWLNSRGLFVGQSRPPALPRLRGGARRRRHRDFRGLDGKRALVTLFRRAVDFLKERISWQIFISVGFLDHSTAPGKATS
jgi:hypothetical protein